MDKVLIVGNKGLLGSSWMSLQRYTLVGIDQDDLDITDGAKLREFITKIRPQYIINCAAINAVDALEEDTELQALAKKVNLDAVAELTSIANDIEATLVHYSSDYVFDGEKNTPYIESDIKNPLSQYGILKSASEDAAKIAKKHYVIRLSRLFGKGNGEKGKKTFPDIIATKMEEEPEIFLVDDEHASMTYAPDLVDFSCQLISEEYPYGVYHGANDGGGSWYDWGALVAEYVNYSGKLTAVSSASFPRPAKRPTYSLLKNEKGPSVRNWKDAMKEFYE